MDAPARYLPRLCDGPNSVAADGSGKHRLYTENILREMRAPMRRSGMSSSASALSVRQARQDNRFHGEHPLSREDFYFKPPAKPRETLGTAQAVRGRAERNLLKMQAIPDRYSPTWSIIRAGISPSLPGRNSTAYSHGRVRSGSAWRMPA